MRCAIHFDDQRDAVIHGHGQRLGAAHAAESSGDGEAATQRAAEMLSRHGGQGLVRALQDALRADVDPGAGGHLAVHRQTPILEVAEIRPRSPRPARGAHWRCNTRGAQRCVRKTPTGLPDWTRSVSSSLERAERPRRSRRRPASCARPGPSRRRRSRSSGRSATSGSRLFMSIRRAASCGQPLQDNSVPRGARTRRAVVVMPQPGEWDGPDCSDALASGKSPL